MAKSISDPKVQLAIGGAIVVLAGIVALTHYKFPAKNANLDYRVLNKPLTSNTNDQNISLTNTSVQNTYTFPGKLAPEKIHHKQVQMITNKGEIVFTLDDAQAPLAVSNFVYLAEQKYFDKLTWHRVVPGFVIQGGDPTGTGRGGPGYQFPDEPVTGDYTAGTVAMANAGPNTNGSQFFIVLENQPTLPKSYTIFGHVTKGLDVAHTIIVGDTMQTVTIEPQS